MNLEELHKVCISNIMCEMDMYEKRNLGTNKEKLHRSRPRRKNNQPEKFVPPVCYFHLDHDYLELSRTPCLFPFRYEKNTVSESKLDDQPTKDDPPVNVIRSQFVIKTPEFPYVHDPVSFDLAGIEEIDKDGNPVDVRQSLMPLVNRCLIHPFCDGNRKPKRRKLLKKFGIKPKKPANPNSSGQVLVCVENQKKFKSGVHRVPRSTDYAMADANSNSENSENVHDKALCKKLYKQLLAKKKGQYSVPLTCIICHSRFSARNSLLQHYLTKADLKIKCHQCGQLFTRRFSLKYHMSIHANYKRFTCKIEGCSKSFRHPHHFKNHIKDHEGPHSCCFCTSVIRSIVTYKRHLKVKHGKIFTKEGTIEDDPDFRSTN